MLNSTTMEAWEVCTIDVLLRLRTWAIRYGASPLRSWDMLSERVRLATRRATTVADWVNTVMRSFRISSVDSDTSAAIVELSAIVGPDDVQEWLTWVETSHQFLMAAARMRFDHEKKSRKAKPTKATAAKPTKPAQGELI